jgi:DNA-binding winged helix-turn-helix (wHTH) protein
MEIDPDGVELRRAGVRVPVEPQVFEVLAYLVEHRDRVVPKEELMDRIWGGRFVSESAVTSRIKQGRQAIGDNGQAQRLIRTVHGKGYRFVGTVRTAATDAAPRHEPVGYAESDGLQIA